MTERDKRIEEVARQIALDHDLDPDDARLGYPAWRIPWILEEAERRLNGELTMKPIMEIDPSNNPDGTCWTVVETLDGKTLSRTRFGYEYEARWFAQNLVPRSKGLVHLEGPISGSLK